MGALPAVVALLYYAIILRQKVTKFMAKYYTKGCHNFKAEKVTIFMAECYTIVCHTFKAKKSPNLWKNITL